MDQRAGPAPPQDPGGRCGDLVATGQVGSRGQPRPRRDHTIYWGLWERQVRCRERARRTCSAGGCEPMGGSPYILPTALAAPSLPPLFSVFLAAPIVSPGPSTKGLSRPPARPEPARVGRTQAVYSFLPAAGGWRPPSSLHASERQRPDPPSRKLGPACDLAGGAVGGVHRPPPPSPALCLALRRLLPKGPHLYWFGSFWNRRRLLGPVWAFPAPPRFLGVGP